MPDNFSLSLELVLLMNWLLKKEKRKIKSLINKTLEKGFYEELDNIDKYDKEDPDSIGELHASILDFLIFMEDSLLDALEQKDNQDKSKEKLQPTIQKINNQNVDLQTLWLSAQQAQTQIRKETRKEEAKTQKESSRKLRPINNEEAKRILLSQLLKNWKPKNNDPLN